jgi:hypothetical protein
VRQKNDGILQKGFDGGMVAGYKPPPDAEGAGDGARKQKENKVLANRFGVLVWSWLVGLSQAVQPLKTKSETVKISG